MSSNTYNSINKIDPMLKTGHLFSALYEGIYGVTAP